MMVVGRLEKCCKCREYATKNWDFILVLVLVPNCELGKNMDEIFNW
jgi:hypothetical protein